MRIRGFLDGANRQRIRGWAKDLDSPDPLSLVITVNGTLAGRTIANILRNDLKKIDGEGRMAFEFEFAEPLSPLERSVVSVFSEVDGTPLRQTPWTIEPAAIFTGETRQAMAKVLAAFETDEEAEERLAFLAEQTEAVLRARRDAREVPNAPETLRKLRLRNGPDMDAPPAKPRALVIDDKVPVMSRDAGSVAIISHMHALARFGYDISFVASPVSRQAPPPELGGVVVFSRPWYASVEEVLASHRGTFDLVYLHRLANASAYALLVRRYQPAARVIFSVADLASVRLLRQARREQRPELEAFGRREAALELTVCQLVDAVITHSSFEADLLRRHLRNNNVHVVPFGVVSQQAATPFASRTGLAFIGGYAHPPNVDAALWLAEHIMPEVAALNASIRCVLAGSAMPDTLRALASETIEPVGAVDDLVLIFNRVRLTVAPLTFGAGVKGKVLESLAAGIPCVCTPVAAEGLDLPESLAQLVATNAKAFAALIVRLHEDETFNTACAEAGLAYIAARNSTEAIDSSILPAVQRAKIS